MLSNRLPGLESPISITTLLIIKNQLVYCNVGGIECHEL